MNEEKTKQFYCISWEMPLWFEQLSVFIIIIVIIINRFKKERMKKIHIEIGTVSVENLNAAHNHITSHPYILCVYASLLESFACVVYMESVARQAAVQHVQAVKIRVVNKRMMMLCLRCSTTMKPTKSNAMFNRLINKCAYIKWRDLYEKGQAQTHTHTRRKANREKRRTNGTERKSVR